MRSIALYTPSFGSPHDPVLHGVASGLADLFPPVEHLLGQEDVLREDPATMPEIKPEEEA